MAVYKVPSDVYAAEKRRDRGLIINFCVGVVSFLIGGFGGGALIYQQYKKYDDPNIRKIVAAYELMLNDWFFGENSEAMADLLAQEAIDAILASGNDPYTFYTASMAEQNLTLNANGIGIASVYYGGHRYITDVYDDSSADGILNIGDIIQEIYVNEQWINLRDVSEEEGTNYMRGPENEIALKIMTKDNELIDITLEKTKYQVTAVSLIDDYLDSNDNLCVTIKVRSFLSESLRKTVTKILSDMETKYDKKVNKLTIDLRNNGGGYVNSAVDLCSMFVPQNSIVVRQRYRDGTEYLYKTSKTPNFDYINNFVIIQNSRSASASESFATAIKDLLPQKAHIVGATSYGKGIIQSFKSFSDGSVIRYTIAQAFSPNEYSIHGIGLEPDENYALEYDYELLFTNYVKYDELSSFAKDEICRQISLLLNQQHESFFAAISDFQTQYSLPVTGDADRMTKLTLQQTLMDYYFLINQQTNDIARGAE